MARAIGARASAPRRAGRGRRRARARRDARSARARSRRGSGPCACRAAPRAEREAALGVVELRRADAEIGDSPSTRGCPRAASTVRDLAERARARGSRARRTGRAAREPLRARAGRDRCRSDARRARERSRMRSAWPAAAERAVDVHAAGARRERLDRLPSRTVTCAKSVTGRAPRDASPSRRASRSSRAPVAQRIEALLAQSSTCCPCPPRAHRARALRASAGSPERGGGRDVSTSHSTAPET